MRILQGRPHVRRCTKRHLSVCRRATDSPPAGRWGAEGRGLTDRPMDGWMDGWYTERVVIDVTPRSIIYRRLRRIRRVFHDDDGDRATRRITTAYRTLCNNVILLLLCVTITILIVKRGSCPSAVKTRVDVPRRRFVYIARASSPRLDRCAYETTIVTRRKAVPSEKSLGGNLFMCRLWIIKMM